MVRFRNYTFSAHIPQEARGRWQLSWQSMTLNIRTNQFCLSHRLPQDLPFESPVYSRASHSQKIKILRAVTLSTWFADWQLLCPAANEKMLKNTLDMRFLYSKEREITLTDTFSKNKAVFFTKLVWQLWREPGSEGRAQTFWALLWGVRTPGLQSQLWHKGQHLAFMLFSLGRPQAYPVWWILCGEISGQITAALFYNKKPRAWRMNRHA